MNESLWSLVFLTFRARDDDGLPKWVAKALAVLGVVLLLLMVLGRRRQASQREVDEFELEGSRVKRRAGQRYLHFVGRDRVGKSALANALLGTDLFGAEDNPSVVAEYRGPWWIRELPAAAVRLSDPAVLRRHIRPGDAVVVVVDEQLFRAEKRFLEMLDGNFHTTRTLVFINKADLLRNQYTEDEIGELQESVRKTVAPYLREPADVVWGAASGAEGSDVEAFRERLNEVLDRIAT